MRRTAAGAVMIGSLAFSGAAWADICACSARSGNLSASHQGGAGLCSVAEDLGTCAMVQVQAASTLADILGAGRRRALVEVFRESGALLDPDQALFLALTKSPPDWGDDEFPDILTAMAALSLSGDLGRIVEIHAALREHAGIIRPAFRERGAQRRLSLGTYYAVVDYGCLRIGRGSFRVGVCSPFADRPGLP